jgi:unsaturated rhamnogalacturonyl hydrolase
MKRLSWMTLVLLLCVGALLFAASGCGDDDDDMDADDDDDNDDDNTAPGDDDDDDDTSPEDLTAYAVALADTWLATYEPETMGWSWDSGVLMLALWELAELTGETAYHDYARDWVDHHIDQGITIAYNDHVPPTRLALRLFEETGEAKYRGAIDLGKAYINEQAERLPDGALVHMGWTTPQQIWVDSVFMATPFMEEAAALDGEAALNLDAEVQFRRFAAHLQDSSGMYRHRYDARDGSVTPVEADFWGRGNAWVVAASGTALRLLPATLDGYEGIHERFLQQTEAMAEIIDDAGRWHTIMNLPETYLETSVGALVAYGIYQAATAVEVDEALLATADRALRGALDQVVVDEYGKTLLLGTSYGTGPSTWEMYQEVLKGEQVNYGVGATILAITTRHALGRESALPAAQASDETYIAEPGTDDPNEWGYFYLARGDFRSGESAFGEALATDDTDPDANTGLALVEAIRFGMGVLAYLDEYFVGEISLGELLDEMFAEALAVGDGLIARTQQVVATPNFNRVVERLVLTEQGGSTAIGTIEVDGGDVLVLQALAQVLVGAGDLVGGIQGEQAAEIAWADDPIAAFIAVLPGLPKLDLERIGQAVDSLIAACDSLVDAIEVIDAETDDQSDDLIPKSLIYLEGEFGVPGVLLPTPLDELFGFDPASLFDDPLPGALIDFVEQVRGVLSLVRLLLP